MTVPNPLLARSGPQSGWASRKTMWMLFIIVAAAGSAPLLLIFPPANMFSPLGQFVVAVYEYMSDQFWVIAPLIVGAAAALYLARECRSESHMLLLVSALPDREIVRGYLLLAARRLRPLWGVIGGLAVPVALSLFYLWAVCEGEPECTAQRLATVILKVSLFLASLYSLLLSLTLLALTLALASALSTRRTDAALGITLAGLTLVIMVCWALAERVSVQPLIEITNIPLDWVIALHAALRLFPALLFGVASLALYHVTPSWVRSRRTL